MLDAIARVITSPLGFFTDLAEDEKKAGGAFWVVLLVVVLSAVSAYFATLPQADAFGPDSPIAGFAVIAAVIIASLFSLLSWLIFGLLARIAAGMNVKPWAVVGYAMSPQLLISTLIIIIAVLFPVKVTPIIADFSDVEAIREASARLTQEIQSSIYGRSSMILSYVSAAWWLFLIYLGLRETSKDAAKAIRGTVLIGVVYAAFLLGPWLFGNLR